HQVAGERRLDRVFGRFQIANFADQHYVGVVTQDTAQAGGKRQPDLGVNLDLVDSFQLILHRVFGGDDLDLFVLDLVERAVQARRFSRAGWSSDQNDAVRQLDELAELVVNLFVHAHSAQ